MTTQNLTTLNKAQIQDLLRSESQPNWAHYATDTLIEAALSVDSNLAFFDLKSYRGTAQECDTRNRMLAIQALNKYFANPVPNADADLDEPVEVVEQVALAATAAEVAEPEDEAEDEDEDDPSDDEEESSEEDEADEEDEDGDDEDEVEEDLSDVLSPADVEASMQISEILESTERPVALVFDAITETLDDDQISLLTEVLIERLDDEDLDDEDDDGDSDDDEDEDGTDVEGEFDDMSDIFYADQSAIAANLVIVLSAADTKELFPHRRALASVKTVNVADEPITVDMVRVLAGFGSESVKSDSRLDAPKGLLSAGLDAAFEHVEHFNSRDLLIAAGSAGQFVRAVNALAARLSDEVLTSFHNSFENLGLVDFNQETQHGSFNAGSFVSVRASVAPVTADSTVSTAITVFVQLRVPGMYSTRLRDKYIQSIVDYIELNDVTTPVTLMVSANATDLLFDNVLTTQATPKAAAQSYDLQDILKQSETTQLYGFQAFSMSQLLDIAESVNRAHEDDLTLDVDSDDDEIETPDIDSPVSAAAEADFNLSILPLNGTATGMLPWGDTHALIADLNSADADDEDEDGDDEESGDMEGLDFPDAE